ncbi:MAG TPA: DUF899 family protein [Sphingopyxis sp.]|nr:DUF899 family protein [Sphingopyxis sp.]
MGQHFFPPSAPALASRRLPLAGEDEAYAIARRALLAEEIDLRRKLAQLAQIRRSLPPGPLLLSYEFRDAEGQIRPLAEMFRERDVLILYACDFGAIGPAPTCYHFLAAMQANADVLRNYAEFCVISLAPALDVHRFSEMHQWQPLNPYEITDLRFAADMHLFDKQDQFRSSLIICRNSPDGVRLFWKSEMNADMMDPGESPRDMFELASLWAILDLTPIGRPTDALLAPEPFRSGRGQAVGRDAATGRWPRPVYGIA